MRPRDFDRVASTPCDMLVIGGGIYALATALEGASRGLRTTLVHVDDFGVGASFHDRRLGYGGLHLLRNGRLGRARRAVRERRALARIAPWLLRPLPYIVATYRSAARSRLLLRAAFKVDSWIGRDRNAGVEPELHLPAARLVSKAATLRLFAGVRAEGLTGGAQWYDYQILDADRLVVAFAAAAERAGAELANHVEPLGIVRDGGRVAGIRLRDKLSGREAELRAAVVVNASDGDAGRTMTLLGVRQPPAMLEMMSLVTSRRASDMALVAAASDGRLLTVVPWRGRAVVGSSIAPVDSGGNAEAAAESRVTAFLEEANRAFPALALTRSDVTFVQRAIVAATAGSTPEVLPEPRVVDHAGDGADGAITVLGAHYMAARSTARQTVALASRKIGRHLAHRRTDASALPGAGIADHEALAIETARDAGLELPLPLIRHLITRYAEHAAVIVQLMAAEPRLQTPLHPDHPHVAAEVIYAIRHEKAVHLADIVVRRLGLGASGPVSRAVLEAAAALAAPELGWENSRVAAEIARV
jgi:glycerol-3-phosphate dehydrogenase